METLQAYEEKIGRLNDAGENLHARMRELEAVNADLLAACEKAMGALIERKADCRLVAMEILSIVIAKARGET